MVVTVVGCTKLDTPTKKQARNETRVAQTIEATAITTFAYNYTLKQRYRISCFKTEGIATFNVIQRNSKQRKQGYKNTFKAEAIECKGGNGYKNKAIKI